MSIHFISGKPGGGKSFYGLKLIVEELCVGNRAIFTNIPLNVSVLNDYLQREYPSKSIDIFRVRVLTDEETAEFWTYRPGGVRIGRLSKQQWSEGEMPDYSGVVDHGVMFVIDEVHNFFGARQWSETGRDVLHYLSQHRKLSDTVVCITQAIGNVDKQFRSVTQDFTFVRNMSKERYGMFRLPSLFIRKTFSSPPTDTSSPMETGTFRLDVKGLACCYDSAQGVGIHGRSADKQELNRGLHWVWYLVGVGAFAAVVFLVVPPVVAGIFTKPLRQTTHVVTQSVVASRPVTVQAGRRDPVMNNHSPWETTPPPRVSLPVTAAGAVTNELYVTAFSVWPGRVHVGLSDGRLYRWPDDKCLQFIGNDFVIIDGVVIRRRH